MTATSELRRLLDERGVEWDKGAFPNETRTYWREMVSVPWDEQRLYVMALFTPEQAVEATLGRGTCKASKQRSMDGKVRGWQCHGCGAAIVTAPTDEEWPELPNYCPECGRKVTA